MKKIVLTIIGILLVVSNAFSQDMTIDSSGNVGIGTLSPTEKLSVNGVIETQSGGIKFPDGSMQSTAYTNVGNYCWEFYVGGNLGGFIKLSMIKLNINNYISSGYSTNTSTSATGAINGNAILLNNQMLMTLTESHIDQYATSISTYSLVLDDLTWNGTFYVIGQDYSYSQGAFEPLNHTSGSAVNVPCP